jgi:hypothetical protein
MVFGFLKSLVTKNKTLNKKPSSALSTTRIVPETMHEPGSRFFISKHHFDLIEYEERKQAEFRQWEKMRQATMTVPNQQSWVMPPEAPSNPAPTDQNSATTKADPNADPNAVFNGQPPLVGPPPQSMSEEQHVKRLKRVTKLHMFKYVCTEWGLNTTSHG